MKIPHEGPWGLPIPFKNWLAYAIGGTIASFIITGIAYEFTTASFVGAISNAEAVGLLFLILYFAIGIGPLSPFRVSTEDHSDVE